MEPSVSWSSCLSTECLSIQRIHMTVSCLCWTEKRWYHRLRRRDCRLVNYESLLDSVWCISRWLVINTYCLPRSPKILMEGEYNSSLPHSHRRLFQTYESGGSNNCHYLWTGEEVKTTINAMYILREMFFTFKVLRSRAEESATSEQLAVVRPRTINDNVD